MLQLVHLTQGCAARPQVGSLAQRRHIAPQTDGASLRTMPWGTNGHPRRVACRSSRDDDLHLVKSEVLQDGSSLFVFGTEDEARHATASHPAATDAGAAAVVVRNPEHEVRAAATAASPSAPCLNVDVAAAEHTTTSASTAVLTPTVAEVAAAANGSSSKTRVEKASPAQQQPAASTSNGKQALATAAAAAEGAATAALSHDHLAALKVADLRELCKARAIKGYSKARKDDLIDMLLAERAP